MQSRTENRENCNQIMHKINLPRGYFKKRKTFLPNAHYKDKFMTQNCSFKLSAKYLNFVNTENLTKYLIVLIIMMTFGTAHSSTLEPDLTVMGLGSATSSPQLFKGDGICSTIMLRFFVEELESMKSCRVVEGSVSLLLMDEFQEDKFQNYTFPDLVEITGYLLIYRLSGIKSLNEFFPNLAVIRGRDLFKDYSLIIYELEDLEEIGLTNLQTIERGSVRIEKNDQLCLADQVDWSAIISGSREDYIAKNKLSAYCPKCPSECPRSKTDIRSTNCWNLQNCQIKCHCNGSVCTKSGKCCDPSCVGGCDEDNPKKCTACKNYEYVNDAGNTECRDSCPPGTYKYLDRRCISKKLCEDFNNSTMKEPQSLLPYIAFNTTCMRGCPPENSHDKEGNSYVCKPCGSGCLKVCQSKIIDSIAAAQSLKGCAIIDGPLEIQIRSASKTPDASSNIVKELENSLSDIVEIRGFLKVSRSFPIVSLSFLKKLKTIRGESLETGKYSVIVWENQNLQELFEKGQKIKIEKGKLFFHFNPKLCFYKIEELSNDTNVLIENLETAQKSNGDKTPCNVKPLDVKVTSIFPKAALLTWTPLKLGDERSLLNYVVFYIYAPHQNVTLWDGRDACGNDGWLVDDVNLFDPSDAYISHPLVRLEPYTQYAYYVKAYTLATERTGAQSEIQYFRTLAFQPQGVTKLKETPKSSSSILVSWERPKKVNGNLTHYILRAKLLHYKDVHELRDYCQEPVQPSETIIKEEKPTAEPMKSEPDGIVQKLVKCDCNTCVQTCQKAEKDGDEQRQTAIDFENEIQDLVYVKSEVAESNHRDGRTKRDVQDLPPSFPDNPQTETTQRRPGDQSLSERNSDNEYTYFYQQINDTNATTFELHDLRHYSHYQIFVKACRLPIEDDLKPADVTDDECGPETQITGRTMKKEENDLITIFEAKKHPSNNSYGSIKLTWEAPKNPNGMILSYNIRYRKNDVDTAKYDAHCYTHRQFSKTEFYIIESLSNGNYSIQIAATSMAGTGNWTAVQNVVINENTSNNYGWIVAGLLAVFVILALGLFIAFKRYYIASISSMKLIANVNPDYATCTYKQDSWEVPRDRIIQMHELGQGSFGMVYEGIIKDLKGDGVDSKCAIKTVNENATDKERISFLNEASVMKQFDTAFVVRLLGVVSQSQPTFVVMELMSNGDLKGYLRSHRPEYDNGTEPPPQPPTLRQILQMAAEIADGMSYLAAKKFVHRDLAARNCMVAEDMTVKIGDFGMTRDIYETDYYRKGTKGLLPVRWMSPESLKDGVFTSSSDVFSYGVVLWEMATLASQPYQGLSNDQVLRYVIDGGVMERPENCPDKLYELMRRCWQHRPSGRPSFMEIIEMLLDDVNQNFRTISFFFTKEGQDTFHQQRQGEFAVNITDDVTTPLRQEEEETSSVDGNNFLMEEMMNSDHKLHEL